MKKTLSLVMALAMLVSCFAFSTSATAKSLPELPLDGVLTVTAPKTGTEETAVKLASFTPAESGCYEFECTKAYVNTPVSDEEDALIPDGTFSLELFDGENGRSTQGMVWFMDFSHLPAEQYEQFAELYKSLGGDIANANIPKFTAELEKGVTYILMMYQTGAEDYTTDITVKKHTHTLIKGQEEKVAVNKDGTSDDLGGIYDTCSDWFCTYLDYTTVYKQLDSTKVKNAVYTGKAVKPAVVIRTADGKKLNKKYYTVTYKNNKKIGKGTAVIKFRNGYTGTVKKTFKINPKATAIKKTVAKKKALKVSYKKQKNVSGYQVQVATNKKFTKNKKTVTVKGAKKTAATVKKLKAGKKYYVRVRTYKVVSGKKYYSSWSKVKAKTPKK